MTVDRLVIERTVSRSRETVLVSLGVLLLVVAAVVNSYAAAPNGADFGCYAFPAAQTFADGGDIYVLSGDPRRLHDAQIGLAPPIAIPANAYPPFHAAVLLPLLPLGEHAAQYVFLYISLGVLCFAFYRFSRIVLPELSDGAHLVVASACLLASSVRWTSHQVQFSLLSLALMLFAFEAELKNRPKLVIACMVLVVKTTIVLPMFAVLLFRRKIASLLAIGGITLALNAACLAWMGFSESLAGWRLNMANYITPNGLNYPSVRTLIDRAHGLVLQATSPPGVIMNSGFDYYYYPEHTHWVLSFSALLPTFQDANRASLALSAFFAVVLAWLGFSIRDRANDLDTILRWFVVWSCFGLVCMTHLKYDLIILIPVVLVAVGQYMKTRSRLDLALALLGFVTAFCLSSKMAATWIFGFALPSAQYWLIPIYAHLATLAFALALWALARDVADTGRSSGLRVHSIV